MDTKPNVELPELECTAEDWAIGYRLGGYDPAVRPECDRICRRAAELACRERQLLATLQSIAALTARAEKAERERDEAHAAFMVIEEESRGQMKRASIAETELAAVHKRLDAISEEDRMTRNANSNTTEGGDSYDL